MDRYLSNQESFNQNVDGLDIEYPVEVIEWGEKGDWKDVDNFTAEDYDVENGEDIGVMFAKVNEGDVLLLRQGSDPDTDGLKGVLATIASSYGEDSDKKEVGLLVTYKQPGAKEGDGRYISVTPINQGLGIYEKIGIDEFTITAEELHVLTSSNDRLIQFAGKADEGLPEFVQQTRFLEKKYVDLENKLYENGTLRKDDIPAIKAALVAAKSALEKEDQELQRQLHEKHLNKINDFRKSLLRNTWHSYVADGEFGYDNYNEEGLRVLFNSAEKELDALRDDLYIESVDNDFGKLDQYVAGIKRLRKEMFGDISVGDDKGLKATSPKNTESAPDTAQQKLQVENMAVASWPPYHPKQDAESVSYSEEYVFALATENKAVKVQFEQGNRVPGSVKVLADLVLKNGGELTFVIKSSADNPKLTERVDTDHIEIMPVSPNDVVGWDEVGQDSVTVMKDDLFEMFNLEHIEFGEEQLGLVDNIELRDQLEKDYQQVLGNINIEEPSSEDFIKVKQALAKLYGRISLLGDGIEKDTCQKYLNRTLATRVGMFEYYHQGVLNQFDKNHEKFQGFADEDDFEKTRSGEINVIEAEKKANVVHAFEDIGDNDFRIFDETVKFVEDLMWEDYVTESINGGTEPNGDAVNNEENSQLNAGGTSDDWPLTEQYENSDTGAVVEDDIDWVKTPTEDDGGAMNEDIPVDTWDDQDTEDEVDSGPRLTNNINLDEVALSPVDIESIAVKNEKGEVVDKITPEKYKDIVAFASLMGTKINNTSGNGFVVEGNNEGNITINSGMSAAEVLVLFEKFNARADETAIAKGVAVVSESGLVPEAPKETKAEKQERKRRKKIQKAKLKKLKLKNRLLKQQIASQGSGDQVSTNNAAQYGPPVPPGYDVTNPLGTQFGPELPPGYDSRTSFEITKEDVESWSSNLRRDYVNWAKKIMDVEGLSDNPTSIAEFIERVDGIAPGFADLTVGQQMMIFHTMLQKVYTETLRIADEKHVERRRRAKGFRKLFQSLTGDLEDDKHKQKDAHSEVIGRKLGDVGLTQDFVDLIQIVDTYESDGVIDRLNYKEPDVRAGETEGTIVAHYVLQQDFGIDESVVLSPETISVFDKYNEAVSVWQNIPASYNYNGMEGRFARTSREVKYDEGHEKYLAAKNELLNEMVSVRLAEDPNLNPLKAKADIVTVMSSVENGINIRKRYVAHPKAADILENVGHQKMRRNPDWATVFRRTRLATGVGTAAASATGLMAVTSAGALVAPSLAIGAAGFGGHKRARKLLEALDESARYDDVDSPEEGGAWLEKKMHKLSRNISGTEVTEVEKTYQRYEKNPDGSYKKDASGNLVKETYTKTTHEDSLERSNLPKATTLAENLEKQVERIRVVNELLDAGIFEGKVVNIDHMPEEAKKYAHKTIKAFDALKRIDELFNDSAALTALSNEEKKSLYNEAGSAYKYFQGTVLSGAGDRLRTMAVYTHKRIDAGEIKFSSKKDQFTEEYQLIQALDRAETEGLVGAQNIEKRIEEGKAYSQLGFYLEKFRLRAQRIESYQNKGGVIKSGKLTVQETTDFADLVRPASFAPTQAKHERVETFNLGKFNTRHEDQYRLNGEYAQKLEEYVNGGLDKDLIPESERPQAISKKRNELIVQQKEQEKNELDSYLKEYGRMTEPDIAVVMTSFEAALTNAESGKSALENAGINSANYSAMSRMEKKLEKTRLELSEERSKYYMRSIAMNAGMGVVLVGGAGLAGAGLGTIVEKTGVVGWLKDRLPDMKFGSLGASSTDSTAPTRVGSLAETLTAPADLFPGDIYDVQPGDKLENIARLYLERIPGFADLPDQEQLRIVYNEVLCKLSDGAVERITDTAGDNDWIESTRAIINDPDFIQFDKDHLDFSGVDLTEVQEAVDAVRGPVTDPVPVLAAPLDAPVTTLDPVLPTVEAVSPVPAPTSPEIPVVTDDSSVSSKYDPVTSGERTAAPTTSAVEATTPAAPVKKWVAPEPYNPLLETTDVSGEKPVPTSSLGGKSYGDNFEIIPPNEVSVPEIREHNASGISAATNSIDMAGSSYEPPVKSEKLLSGNKVVTESNQIDLSPAGNEFAETVPTSVEWPGGSAFSGNAGKLVEMPTEIFGDEFEAFQNNYRVDDEGRRFISFMLDSTGSDLPTPHAWAYVDQYGNLPTNENGNYIFSSVETIPGNSAGRPPQYLDFSKGSLQEQAMLNYAGRWHQDSLEQANKALNAGPGVNRSLDVKEWVGGLKNNS